MIIFSLHETLNSGHDHTLQSTCRKNTLDYFRSDKAPAWGPNLAVGSSSSGAWQIPPSERGLAGALRPPARSYCWDRSIWGGVRDG